MRPNCRLSSRATDRLTRGNRHRPLSVQGLSVMVFTQTVLPDAFIVDMERRSDERGFFARSWCEREFEAHGLCSRLVQCSVSRSHRKGTLRGMHYQEPPYAETKLVRCTTGAIYDVIIDLRTESSTFKKHLGIVLCAEESRSLYVPEGFAHGFLTLTDNAEVLYQMSAVYEPSAARGVRWNDPAFEIAWPEAVTVISDRDRTYPDYSSHA
jgi:dTDP-4-dehydrorhamnose 3,5-epimerase